MVPHIATEATAANVVDSEMTNSEMELTSGQQQQLEDEMSRVQSGVNGIVFGSQLIDQNSATPYSDATKVRAHLRYPPNVYYSLGSAKWRVKVQIDD